MADKTVDELPLLTNPNFTVGDYFMLWDESTGVSKKFSVAQYRNDVLSFGLQGGNYNGTLNAETLSNVPTATYANGDWFFIDVAGTMQGIDFDVHDIIKYNGTSWERVPRGIVVAANSRQTVLSSNVSVPADGEHPIADPTGQASGWYYNNSTNGKINWYFYGGTGTFTETNLGNLATMWAVVNLKNGYFFMQAYTKPTGSGDASWYKSKVNYNDNSGQLLQNLPDGRYLVYTGDGSHVAGVHPEIAASERIQLPYDATFSVGTQSADEDVWLLALSTSSGDAAGSHEFTVEEVGYQFGMQKHTMDLVGVQGDFVESDPLFSASFKGNFANEAALPAATAGQWAINDETDSIWIYDGDTSAWVEAKGASAVPVADIPYVYSYGDDNGTQTGYGWMNADMADWNGLPNGALVADSGSFRPVDATVKFATLKSVGDKVAIQDVNITNFGTYYYRHAFFYYMGGETPVWSTNNYNDVGSGTGYYVEGDDSKVFGHNCWVNPYYGATSYGGGMLGPNGSNYSPADKSSVTLEWEIIDYGGGDTRLQMKVDGHVLAVSASPLVDGFATNGIDLYILAKHQQVWPQPSGGAANDPNPPGGDPWPGPHVGGADFDGVNNRIKIPASAIDSVDWHPDDNSRWTVTAQLTTDMSFASRISLYTTAEANWDIALTTYYGYYEGFSADSVWNIPQKIWYDTNDKMYRGSRNVISQTWSGKNSELVTHATYVGSQKWLRTDYKGFYDSATKIFTLDDAGEYLWQYAVFPGNSWSFGMNTAGEWTRFLSIENALKTGGVNNYNQTWINSPGKTLANGQKIPTQLFATSGWSTHINGELTCGSGTLTGDGSNNPMNYLGNGRDAYIQMRSYDDTFTNVSYGKSADMNEWVLTSGLDHTKMASLHAHIADAVDVRTWITANPGVDLRLYYPMGDVTGNGVVKDYSGNAFDAASEGMD